MDSLEQRLRRIEDRFELQDLIVRYFLASDDDDLDVIADSFSDDGVFAGPGFTGGSTREEVMYFIRTFREAVGQSVHTPHFQLLEFLDDDHAKGVVGAHIEISLGDQTMFGAFRYHDEYVRENGRWRFARRELLTVHVAPWEDVGTSLTQAKNIRWPGSEPMPSHFAPRQRQATDG